MVEDLFSDDLHVIFVVIGFVLIVHKSQVLPNSKNLRIICDKIDRNLFIFEVHMLLLKTLEALLEIWVLLKQLLHLTQVFVRISS